MVKCVLRTMRRVSRGARGIWSSCRGAWRGAPACLTAPSSTTVIGIQKRSLLDIRANEGRMKSRALRLLLLVVLALTAGGCLRLRAGRRDTPPTTGSVDNSQWLKALQPATSRTADNAAHRRPTPPTADTHAATAPPPLRASRQGNLEDSSALLIAKITDSTKNVAAAGGDDRRRVEPGWPLCDSMPPDLGPVPVNTTDIELVAVEQKYPAVHWGGHYRPPACVARHRVAIIVPYRDRPQHLAIFLNHMHSFLMKQQIEYGIFIVEQEGTRAFNRAKLMNVGFVESQKQKAGGWQCFIFHDIDLLPLDQRNLYSCPRQPRHMSVAIDKYNFKLPYEEIFGGVSALTLEQFQKVNGFSNRYWGWGGEDDDMYSRLTTKNYHIARYTMSIARYAMLTHKDSTPNPQRHLLLHLTNTSLMGDGLSTLRYAPATVTRRRLYTRVAANIDDHSWWAQPKVYAKTWHPVYVAIP